MTVESAKKYLGRLLIRSMNDFYANKENQRDFEDWYLKKYGKPYVKSRENVK